ncbi:MAG: TerB family tellurite resistance protein [Candidatus Neomarinimicrobiota bacterium]|nr:TerB family tellurite resistance protein [Candidatus Neomarinimicrobiota bacterium]|tara:strand:- start:598 stop:1005 length:408 start_codon:yes stop_codon:yes gene_type:complete
MDKIHDSHQTHLAAACLLLSIAEADEILQQNELDTICDILKDFFSLTNNESSKLLIEAQKQLNDSIDLFEFGQHLNITFDQSDKLDFIGCVFEIAFSDGDLHYLEHHTIKKIAHILNLSKHEVIKSKQEIERFYV